MKRFLCCLVYIYFSLPVLAQSDTAQTLQKDSSVIANTPASGFRSTARQTKQSRYNLRPVVDIPVFSAGAGWSAYAFTRIYSKPHSADEEILNLNRNNINWFDRWAVRPFSKSEDKISYYPFFASMPLPFLFLAGKSTRKDFFKLTFLYLEAMSVTGSLYTASVYFANRYRPYAYSDQSSLAQRTRGGAKNSFYAGHPALVATSTFFMAKVYADYHPDSKSKWIFYSLAGASTALTAYLRYRAGQHFPSDLPLGMVQGTFTGLLVPQFHKSKLRRHTNLSLLPFGDGDTLGIAAIYTLPYKQSKFSD